MQEFSNRLLDFSFLLSANHLALHKRHPKYPMIVTTLLFLTFYSVQKSDFRHTNQFQLLTGPFNFIRKKHQMSTYIL